MPAPGGTGLVTDLSAAWITILLDAALKGTVLLLLAALASRLLSDAPAAARHLVWATALVGLLALPALAPLTPGLEVPFLPRIELTSAVPEPTAANAREAPGRVGAPALRGVPDGGSETGDPAAVPREAVSPGPDAATGTADAAPWGSGWLVRTDPLLLLGGAWLLGALFVLTGLVVGKVRIRWLARDADRVRDGPWAELQGRIEDRLGLDREVVLLRSARPLVPMTWGVFRSRVLMPETAATWPDACLRNVLLHELAHVKRRDCLVQLLARLACAVYWFHPLAWHALRRLRLEQEEACDDHVLRDGTLASDYARQLVGMARILRAVRTPAHAGSTGVGRSDFMRRMRALLDAGRSRRPLARRTAATLASAAGAVVLALAAARPAGPADDPVGDAGPASLAAEDRSGLSATAEEPLNLSVAVLPGLPAGGASDGPDGGGSASGPRRTDEPAARRRAGPVARRTEGSAARAEVPEPTSRPDPSTGGAPDRPSGAAPAGAGGAGRGQGSGPAEAATPGSDGRGGTPASDGPPARESAAEGVARRATGNDPDREATVAPLEAAFTSYWHTGEDSTAPRDSGAPEAPRTARLASVNASVRDLLAELDDLEDAAARADLLDRSVRAGSIRSLAVLMELTILAPRSADRLAAVRTLAEAPSAARARFLYQVARANPWADVRALAVEQLRRVEPERVVPWLVTLAYGDGDPAVQRRAVTELASLDREGVDTSLMQIARSHPEANVRLEAIIWLIRTGSGQALSKYVENA